MNAVAKKHEAVPADPIAAALAKYQGEMTLPELTATAPDDLLIVHLVRGGQPTTRIQQQVLEVFQQARYSRFAPVELLDDQQAQYGRAVRALWAVNPEPGSRKAADWKCAIAVLRLSLERLATLTAFVARWGNLTDIQRREEAQQAESQRQIARYQQGGSLSGAPSFSMAAFLAGLKGRGIDVTSNGTDLTVTNANNLTPAERHTLTANKPAALAALGAVETF